VRATIGSEAAEASVMRLRAVALVLFLSRPLPVAEARSGTYA
jgi:hypothetical protein